MRAKIFDGMLYGGANVDPVEKDYFEHHLNVWLTENPNVEIIDIRMSTGFKPPQPDQKPGIDVFNVVVLVLYKEAPAPMEHFTA